MLFFGMLLKQEIINQQFSFLIELPAEKDVEKLLNTQKIEL
jgi:hypothetical protein